MYRVLKKRGEMLRIMEYSSCFGHYITQFVIYFRRFCVKPSGWTICAFMKAPPPIPAPAITLNGIFLNRGNTGRRIELFVDVCRCLDLELGTFYEMYRSLA